MIICMLIQKIRKAVILYKLIITIQMHESEQSSQKSEGVFKVAPLISQHKLSQLKVKIVGTLLGLQITNNHHDRQAQNYCQCNLLNIFFYFILPCAVILPPMLITNTQLYPVAVAIPIAILSISHAIINCADQKQNHILTYVALILYGYLWSTQLFIANQYMQVQETLLTGVIPTIIILSILGIITSVSALAVKAPQQFSGTSTHHQKFQLHSTFGMRFIVCLPTLLTTAIIYGFYLGEADNQLNFEEQKNLQYLYLYICRYLMITSSVLSILGLVGWISTLYDILMFVFNYVCNYMVFCDQKFSTLYLAFLVFLMNLSGIILSSSFSEIKLDFNMITIAYFTAWGFSAITAIFIHITYKYSSASQKRMPFESTRFFVTLVLQMLGVAGIYVVYYFGLRQTPGQQGLIIILSINIACYLIFMVFKEISSARSVLGCIGCLNLIPSKKSFVDCFQRFILRMTLTLSMLAIFEAVQPAKLTLSIYPSHQITSLETIYPVLIYRSFKRCLSHPRDHSTHISIIIFLIVLMSSIIQPMEIVLFFPLFPHNPLKILTTPFFIPKKLKHKNENAYRILYFLSSLIALVFMLGTLGMGEFIMIFGLPLYWCVIPKGKVKSSDRQLSQSHAFSPEYAIYQKFVAQLHPNILRGKPPGFYILRVTKYIIYVEIINECYGFFETVTFVGLEAQEVTTCHAKEGETIDKIISEIWDQNEENRVRCKLSDNLFTSIWPIQSVNNIIISGQNQIKLTGIIESEDFYKLFKSTLIRSIIYYYCRFMKNGQNNYENFEAETKELIDDLYLAINKDKCQQIFPYSFAKETGMGFQYPANANNLNKGRKKLPPLNNNKNNAGKKKEVLDDFMDLLDRSGEKSESQLKTDNKKNEETVIEQSKMPAQPVNSTDQKNMAVVLSIYTAILGKVNYLNLQKIVDLLQKQKQTLSQIDYTHKIQLASESVGAALKIAIGKYLEGQTQVAMEDFDYYLKNQYLGTSESTGFSKAVSEGREDIWTVYYAPIKKLMTVKRIAGLETSMYILGINWQISKAVWNNLRYELLYAANDNDERYSIQTHQYLLRNLLIEACQQPFGYAGYYSDEFIIV